MPLNAGFFTRIFNWQQDAADNIDITASRFDDEMDGMATALSQAWYRDGQAPATDDIPMGGNRLTGLGDPVADTDAMNARTADSRYGTSTAVRLTLASGVAVTESDITGGGTIYLTPDGSNTVGLWSGSAWVARPFAETSLQLDATGHTANTNYDIFAYWDGSAVKIGSAPAWAGNTLRGVGTNTSELESFQGRLVNKNSTILRNAGATATTIPARRGLLVGGFRVGSVAGQTEDSQARRFLSNVYGRAERQLKRLESAVSWVYNSSSWRQANGNTANQVEFFSCVSGDRVEARVFAVAINSTTTGRTASVGIGLDQTAVNNATVKRVLSIVNLPTALDSEYAGYPGIGYHSLAWLEQSGTTDTRTFYGDATSLSVEHMSGMIGSVVA